MLTTGFNNSWTSGEISPDALERVDLQPIDKGCAQATNLIVSILGPLRKRRGFWLNGEVPTPSLAARYIPFVRSVTDALMLVFQNAVAYAYEANGAPLMNGPAQVSFPIPYTTSQLPTLRFKQVADVIYITSSLGLQPMALERITLTNWSINPVTYPNGPWLPENIVQTQTVTVSGATQIVDANPTGYGAAAVMTGESVTLTASQASIFAGVQVGDIIRLRQSSGNPSMRSWFAGYYIPAGWFIASAGYVYLCTATAGSAQQASMSTPPVNTSGLQNDGCNTFQYLHDGSGQIQVTAVTSGTVIQGTVLSTLPVGNGQATSYWSWGAYGADVGWPRAWPASVEERIATGGTASNLDMLDLTEASGFSPTTLNYHPGLGTGEVLATDAMRRRAGDTGGEILWFQQDSFLIAGTVDGEYVISGGLFGDPLAPSTIVVRWLSGFGSADVYPVRVANGIAFVTRGNNLRLLDLDLQQNKREKDLSYLASHLFNTPGQPQPTPKPLLQVAWLPDPDWQLWGRFADGSIACFAMHDEQEVYGWTSQALSGGWFVEDMVTLPGENNLNTLWLIASRVVVGVTQRVMLMQSAAGDGLFMDAAQEYSGAGVSELGGFPLQVGQALRVLANGQQVSPDPIVQPGGTIAVPAGTTEALAGEPIPLTFETLKLQTVYPIPGTINDRKEVTTAIVTLYTAGCTIGMLGSLESPELVVCRPIGAAAQAGRITKEVGLSGGDDRDPRIVITEDSCFDFWLYSIKPKEDAGDR